LHPLVYGHSSSADDSTDQPVATERGRKRIKSKKEGTKKRKKSDSTESGKTLRHYKLLPSWVHLTH